LCSFPLSRSRPASCSCASATRPRARGVHLPRRVADRRRHRPRFGPSVAAPERGVAGVPYGRRDRGRARADVARRAHVRAYHPARPHDRGHGAAQLAVAAVLATPRAGRCRRAPTYRSTIRSLALAALYVLFRWVVRTPEEVRRCCWIAIGGACVLSLLAIVQSLGLVHIGGPLDADDDGRRLHRSGRRNAQLVDRRRRLSRVHVHDRCSCGCCHNRGPRVLLRVVTGILVLGFARDRAVLGVDRACSS